MVCYAYGPRALCRRQRRGSRPLGSDHWGSNPAGEACTARPHRSALGRTAASAASGRPCRCEPSRSVALAAAVRRSRGGGSAARQDPAAGQKAGRDRDCQQGAGVDLSAERLPVLQVADRAVSRPAVWRWQRRYAEAGVAGLLHDKTRPPGKKPVAIETVNKVLALTCGDPPGEMTHWTGRAMAKTVSLALHTVQRIWRANRLQPHRLRTFKRSSDPALAEKVEDIVGLYMHPPAHAVVLSIDEKSQIQALDRTQPGLPIKPGKCGTLTHDYKRHGTTTLFAALNTLDGFVHGRCMQRHTHQEFIRFLNTVERAVPAGKVIHAILANYATHKHPKVEAWLARHPR